MSGKAQSVLGTAVAMCVLLSGGCAREYEVRHFQPDDEAGLLQSEVSQHFPRGMARGDVRARAAELRISAQQPAWARLVADGEFWPVPRFGVFGAGRGTLQWADEREVATLGGESSDFFVISDQREYESPASEATVLRTHPSRAMVVWYDAAGKLDGLLVGPLVYTRSSELHDPGYWVHRRENGRTQ